MTGVTTRRRREKLFAGLATLPCCFCGDDLTLDGSTLEHIIPRSKGGTLRRSNCELSCYVCNQLRGSMAYTEFWKRMAPYRLITQPVPLMRRVTLGKRQKVAAVEEKDFTPVKARTPVRKKPKRKTKRMVKGSNLQKASQIAPSPPAWRRV
jgi:hypothetical protein